METLPTDPYALGEGEDAVLLFHGFAGSPFELRPLAYSLARRGFRCVVPLLPGHGRDAERLGTVSEVDWIEAGFGAFDSLLAEGHERIFVVGFSMGGALAIDVAAGRPREVAGLALLAPALALHGPSQLYRRFFRSGLASRLWPFVGKGPGDLADPSVEMPTPDGTFASDRRRARDGDAHGLERLRHARRGRGHKIPTRAALPLDKIIRSARGQLWRVEAPALVIWGGRDRVVPLAAAEEAATRIGSGPAKLVVFPDSAHQLALDYDREAVADRVGDFFEDLAEDAKISDC